MAPLQPCKRDAWDPAPSSAPTDQCSHRDRPGGSTAHLTLWRPNENASGGSTRRDLESSLNAQTCAAYGGERLLCTLTTGYLKS